MPRDRPIPTNTGGSRGPAPAWTLVAQKALPEVAGNPRHRAGERNATGYSQYHCGACGEVHGFGYCAYAARRTRELIRDQPFIWERPLLAGLLAVGTEVDGPIRR